MFNRLIVIVIFSAILIGFGFAMRANAGDFYQWTDTGGAINMTDDVKHIPAKYKDVAVKRSTEDVGKNFPMTPVTVKSADYRAELQATLERQRAIAANTTVTPDLEPCPGAVSVAQVRESYEERGNTYNSMFYVVTDACGQVVSKTRENPRIQINR
jgi:hypothetical protein